MKRYLLTNEDGQQWEVNQISEEEFVMVGHSQIHHASEFGYECTLKEIPEEGGQTLTFTEQELWDGYLQDTLGRDVEPTEAGFQQYIKEVL